MAVYQFSALSAGQAIDFVPTADVLRFDQSVIAAADLRFVAVGANTRIEVVTGSFAGKDITLLNTTPLQISQTNVTFADGSKLLVGDHLSSTTNDNSANSLVGTSGRDHLSGLGGDDTLSGGAGNDYLDGGSGVDAMIGGTGNDTYIVDGPGDTVIENAGEGIDAVLSSASRTLEANVENLTLTGSAAINGTGNALDNMITGNSAANSLAGSSGDDTLSGGEGDDTLSGRGGNDSLTGGAGVDHFVFRDAPTPGRVDRVSDFVSGTDELLFENAVFTGLGAAGGFAAGDGRFRSGAGITTGQDSSDRLVYDTSAGSLYYDADGSGSGASNLIATLQGAPTLVATDLAVI